jgi:DNA topoisomerase-1
MDGNLVLELKAKPRTNCAAMCKIEAAVLALLRGRLAKEAERSKEQRAKAA